VKTGSKQRAQARSEVSEWANSDSKPRNKGEWGSLRGALRVVAADWTREEGEAIAEAETAAEEARSCFQDATAAIEASAVAVEFALRKLGQTGDRLGRATSGPEAVKLLQSMEALRAERDSDKATIVRLREEIWALEAAAERTESLREALHRSVSVTINGIVREMDEKKAQKTRRKVKRRLGESLDELLSDALLDGLAKEEEES